jgi:hypothetical protein
MKFAGYFSFTRKVGGGYDPTKVQNQSIIHFFQSFNTQFLGTPPSHRPPAGLQPAVRLQHCRAPASGPARASYHQLRRAYSCSRCPARPSVVVQITFAPPRSRGRPYSRQAVRPGSDRPDRILLKLSKVITASQAAAAGIITCLIC